MPASRTSSAALVLVLSAVGVLATAPPASAHATLIAMSPANASTVSSAPARVTLTFDESVRASSEIVVTGPAGRVDDGRTRVANNVASVAVLLHPRPSDVGVYRVAYRVVSADGHVVAAQESFRYAPPGVQASRPGSGADALDPASTTTHTWWWVGGVALVVGVAAALMLSGRSRTRRRP